MDVTPLPGRTGQEVLDALRTIHTSLANPLGDDVTTRVTAYVRWAAEATRQLRYLIRSEDLERLILTTGYRTILTLPHESAAVTNAVLDTEVQLRLGELNDTIGRLRACIDRWRGDGVLVVLDTCVYLHAPEKFEDLDIAAAIAVTEDPILLLIPIVVVDELDNLKKSPNNNIRWRAGYSVSFLDRMLRGGVGLTGLLREEDFTALSDGGIPRGAVNGEVVLDPVGHVRLPIADDEIIDRAATIQRIAGRDVHVVTYDTGLAMRARAAGLTVHQLAQPEKPSDAN